MSKPKAIRLEHIRESHFCICSMPDRRSQFSANLPYEQSQKHVLQFQNTGAQSLICGDVNVRTVQEADWVCAYALRYHVNITGAIDELPDHIVPRQNCNKQAPVDQTWGPDLETRTPRALLQCQSAHLKWAPSRQ